MQQPWEILKSYVGSNDPDDDLFIQACWDEAVIRVDRHIGDLEIPDRIYTTAVTEVGANLYNRRGSGQNAGEGLAGVPVVRTSTNPMKTVYPLLAPWKRYF